MPENDENLELDPKEETQEETPELATAESVQVLVETVNSLKAQLAEANKPAPVAAPTAPAPQMPSEYDAASIDQIVQAKLEEALRPVSELVNANEKQRGIELRDGLIGQIAGLSDEDKVKLQTVAQKQFESGAASNYDEAIANASAIVGIKKPNQTQANQDARRAGRQRSSSRAPQETADMDEDAALDAIFSDHNL